MVNVCKSIGKQVSTIPHHHIGPNSRLRTLHRLVHAISGNVFEEFALFVFECFFVKRCKAQFRFKIQSESKFCLEAVNVGSFAQLWSTLPNFCNWASDTATAFPELAKELGAYLTHRPDLRAILCSALQRLIHQNSIVLDGTYDPASAPVFYNSELAKASINGVARCADIGPSASRKQSVFSFTIHGGPMSCTFLCFQSLNLRRFGIDFWIDF